jgi:hypothetical protein
MNNMKTIWTWLSGKKTYIIALAGIIYSGGIQQGWWPHSPLIDGLLLSGGAASIRHGISTASKG